MATTIYFSGSITGGREDVELYQRIVAALEEDGHRVLAGSVAAAHVSAFGEGSDRTAIFLRDRAWLDEADVVVAEVSKPSHGVGYEIAYARYRRAIPVICLFRPAYTQRCSAMIAGDAEIELIEYAEVAELLPRLRESVRRSGRYPARLP
ncbi:MAG TPA: nucleoside 2-deoxyribosyltransferase [Thermoanaerobaculia bacterium]|nr:nucleoside 2-deoxyribosyltransferase [Thermoanaerobaculia bacterium]